ncbi:hypothetical protein BaRGS_00031999 [Batillaria attramentaria]|uniref:Uncharacterized protein n=1 Tax=Batillaria attramentaria TaxID=370345 RepID=A0ABD0JPC2_9CAEN
MGVLCRCVPPMVLNIVLGFLIVWNPASAIVRFRDPKDAVAETANVQFVVSSDRHFTARERREAGGMPSFLQFNVSMGNGNNLELRLWRTPRTDQPFPVHVMRDGKLTEIPVTHDMSGILRHGGELFQLRPHHEAPETPHRQKRSLDTILYIASRIRPMMYGLDTIDESPYSYVSNFDDAEIQVAEMNSRSRQKRETVENVVETYLSADIFNYNRFLADANNNAAQARSDLTQYYAFLEQVVNNVYETYNAAASGGQCIRVRIVGLFIADVSPVKLCSLPTDVLLIMRNTQTEASRTRNP